MDASIFDIFYNKAFPMGAYDQNYTDEQNPSVFIPGGWTNHKELKQRSREK